MPTLVETYELQTGRSPRLADQPVENEHEQATRDAEAITLSRDALRLLDDLRSLRVVDETQRGVRESRARLAVILKDEDEDILAGVYD